MNLSVFLDDFISVFSPGWASRRMAKRLAYEKMRKYYGAQVKKTDRYWLPTGGDADSEIIPDLPRLRARSRDLVRNTPWGVSVMNAFLVNVVGAAGIRPQVPGNTRAGNKLEKYLKEQFEEPENIDLTGEQDFYELQGLALRQFLENGEAFIKIAFGGGSVRRPRLVKLQFLEPDQIYSSRSEYNGNEVRAGIEISRTTGKHLAYFVNTHPGSYGFSDQSETRVLRQDMIHIFLRTRPGQTRAVPVFAPVVQQLHDMGEYVESSLAAARVAACLAVFIRKDHHTTPDEDEDGNKIQSLHPGMIGRLRRGEDIKCLEPKQPGEQFSSFTAFHARSIGAGTGLSYESVSKDYSQVNYSSGRLSKLDERANYRVIQQFLIKHFCRRVEREIQTLRVLRGEQNEPLRVLWQVPGFEWVDPEKEVKSQIIAINSNIKTKAQVIAESGGDIDEVFRQRQKEIELEKELGIESKTDEPASVRRIVIPYNIKEPGIESKVDEPGGAKTTSESAIPAGNT